STVRTKRASVPTTTTRLVDSRTRRVRSCKCGAATRRRSVSGAAERGTGRNSGPGAYWAFGALHGHGEWKPQIVVPVLPTADRCPGGTSVDRTRSDSAPGCPCCVRDPATHLGSTAIWKPVDSAQKKNLFHRTRVSHAGPRCLEGAVGPAARRPTEPAPAPAAALDV